MLPDKKKDFSGWYNTLVKKAGLVDDAPVRGCLILKPYGFALWERIKNILDHRLKETGHSNAYFPLLIPASYFGQEAAHIEGFAKECAVVSHYRIKKSEDGKKMVPDPEAKLEDPLIVRPTSETIIWGAYSKWVQSYRDLPIRLNQWANVVRWEMRTRPFLRTTEFLWQEGHTAHARADEAKDEALKIHQVYHDLAHDALAIPAIKGVKTEHERFAGAVDTYTLEALMQDGKALQIATSHFLGQNFAKAFQVRFADQEGELQYAWGSSWGTTTRLIGALIMTHSDQKGLVLPPKIAPIQVVILPIGKKKKDDSSAYSTVLAQAEAVEKELKAAGIQVVLDADSTQTAGWKFSQYELQGVPLRLTIGPRDVGNKTVELYRRDLQEKANIPLEGVVATVQKMLTEMQEQMFLKAQRFQENHIVSVDSYQAFKKALDQEVPGLILAHWDGTTETEKKIQAETRATIRCIPWQNRQEPGVCIYSGKPSQERVLFAKAY